MDSPSLLTAYELCNRKGIWSRDWKRSKIDIYELLQAGIKAGVTSDRPDFAVAAGEEVVSISAQREIATKQFDVYSEAIHIAALAEIITYAIRKPSEPPWELAESVILPNGTTWHSGAFLSHDGLKLRRVAIASNWSDDKHFDFARSWYSLGESAVYGIPLQQATIILGTHREGRFHGAWSKAMMHPVNRKLKFRKKNDPSTPFKASWKAVFREDYDNIPTSEWLNSMLDDGVLPDVALNIEIPLPSKEVQDQIVDLASRRLDAIFRMKQLPDPNLSTCFWPSRCPFVSPCHSGQTPNGRFGFVRMSDLAQI